jgi:hypothetical protein
MRVDKLCGWIIKLRGCMCGVPVSIRKSVCNRRYVNASVKWCEVLYREEGRDSTPWPVNRSTNHHSVGALISKWFLQNVARNQNNIPRNKPSEIYKSDIRAYMCTTQRNSIQIREVTMRLVQKLNQLNFVLRQISFTVTSRDSYRNAKWIAPN